jgi:Reverse transcriptase (RNA-dependent DNA polymerase)
MIDNVNPMSLAISVENDTMYWDTAMKQHDAENFVKAAIDEVTSHQENGHWRVVKKDEVPEGTPILDAVWSMKRKRRLLTNEIYKWKARLNIHGGQQELGINYWETYAPVITWAAIRLVLVLVLMYKWYTVQIDFVLAYPQADVECDLFMKIPKGFEIEGKTNKTHALKLVKNLYGQKQAGRVWNPRLHKILIEIGWIQSKADDCLYDKGSVMFVVYVDDGILVSASQESIDEELKILRSKFTISVKGTLSDYVGVNIERTDDGKIHMTQPNIIRSILEELNFGNDMKSVETPAPSTTILRSGEGKEPHKADWSY